VNARHHLHHRWGDLVPSELACPDPRPGWARLPGDCDDLNPDVRPDQTEVCNGVDDNCDADVDEGLLVPWYQDADRDTYGDPATETLDCPGARTTPWVLRADDCDDTDRRVNPSRTETCNYIDDNCDGEVDEGLWVTAWRDADGDGFGDDADSRFNCPAVFAGGGWAPIPGDCDDSEALVNPAAVETCNHVDDDCEGGVDEGLTVQLRPDADGDGYGAVTGAVTIGCVGDPGFALSFDDCDDTRAIVHPGRQEACDGIDNDCDLAIDEGVKTRWRLDADADGYWPPGTPEVEECVAPPGHRASSLLIATNDCDDSSADVHPGRQEMCDGIDNNCVGGVDEGVLIAWRLDADRDRYSPTLDEPLACTAPLGHRLATEVQAGLDCDDDRRTVNPGASEICDGLDNNCDGVSERGRELRYIGGVWVSISSGSTSDPTICGAQYTQFHDGSLYIMIDSFARSWAQSETRCASFESHIIRPDGFGVTETYELGDYDDGDFEVAAVRSWAGVPDTSVVHIGLQGGCSTARFNNTWGYQNYDGSCTQVPPIFGLSHRAIPSSWSPYASDSDKAWQLPTTAPPSWPHGVRIPGGGDNWRYGPHSGITICEMEVP
jgi:hypothetical protein